MKRIISFIICLMIPISALADDKFLEDFNVYASSMYGIDEISPVFTGNPKTYASAIVEIMDDGQSVTIMAENKNALDLIAAACCALRTIDNQGSVIDQYGKVMHAYFLTRSGEGEKRATTDSGLQIFISIDHDFMTIRLVR